MADLSEKQKSRESVEASYFCCRLYLDTSDYAVDEVLAKIASFDDWAYIIHNQDVKSDGTPDKDHIHAVFRNVTDDGKGSPTSIGAVAGVLGISSANIQAGRSENDNRGFKGSVRYLIHDTAQARKDNKHLYDRSEIVTNLDLDKLLGESFDMAKSILDYILKERPQSLSQLACWCVDHKLWKEFRRSQYVFVSIMKEVRANEA